MSLINCGEFSIILIIPLITAILNIVNYEIFKYSAYVNHPVISCIISNAILSLFFIPYLFRKFVCNRKSKEKNDYKVNLKARIRHPLLITIILGILYELVNLFHTIFAIKYDWEKPYYENDYLLELCFIHAFYKLFSTKLKYKHHIISIIFILFLAIGYYILEVIFYKFSLIFIFIIFKQILFGVSLVIIEYLMKAKKYSIFGVIFIFGLTGLLIDLIVLLIASNVTCFESLKNNICSAVKFDLNNLGNYILTNPGNNDKSIDYYLDNAQYFYDYIKGIKDQDWLKILICSIIFSMFFAFSTFFSFLIVRKSSPCWSFFTNIIISLYLKIREFFYDTKGEIYIIITTILLILLILFWTFVYTELIELNFCGISDYTENNRTQRNVVDEERSSTWVNNTTIISDADVTLDKSAINAKN